MGITDSHWKIFGIKICLGWPGTDCVEILYDENAMICVRLVLKIDCGQEEYLIGLNVDKTSWQRQSQLMSFTCFVLEGCYIF